MSGMLQISVPAGVGDYWWTHMKLSTLGVPLDVRISADNPPRTQPLMELLPAVVKCDSLGGTFHDLKKRALSSHTHKDFLMESVGSGDRLPLEANTHLDAGNRIEKWLPSVGVDFHPEIRISKAREAEAEAEFPTNTPFLAIFCASRPSILNWKAWLEKDWVVFIQRFRAAFGIERVAVLGAGWDEEFGKALMRSVKAAGLDKVVNLIGKLHIGASLALLKRANYFVGFPSGLSVLAHALKAPATMLYPDQLHLMPGSWVNPEQIANHTFREVLFSKTSPEETVRWIQDVYGKKRLLEGQACRR